MARHKFSTYQPDAEPDLDISSLIDVCFLLLIYFLVTSTIIPEEKQLVVGLPVIGSVNPDVARLAPLFIRVDAMGAVFSGTNDSETPLDTDPTSRNLPLLSSQLQLYSAAAMSAGDRPLVQILVDNGTNQQRVVDVLNALAGSKITSVTFTDLVEM